jgi:hypothetical protein
MSSFCLSDDYDSPYWVLDTDYTSYSVVWSCVQVGGINLRKLKQIQRITLFILYVLNFKENSWVLTREQFPDDLTIGKTQDVINMNGLQEAYETTKHENCPADP